MRRWLLYLGIGFLLLLMQVTLRYYLERWNVSVPNLLLLLVVYLAFHEVNVGGAITAFLLGTLHDLSAGPIVGPWAGPYVAVYCIISSLSQWIFEGAAASTIVIAWLSNVILVFIFHALQMEGGPSIPDPIGPLLIETLVTGLCAPILFPWIRRLSGRRSTSFRPSAW
jgi:rod shape-determining protein MreD